jgi:hypothetical protein
VLLDVAPERGPVGLWLTLGVQSFAPDQGLVDQVDPSSAVLRLSNNTMPSPELPDAPSQTMPGLAGATGRSSMSTGRMPETMRIG